MAKSYLALCASCGEPSVFALVKSSLDCRHWQWHTWPLESVLLDGCCERGFLYHGEGSPTIHHCCPLWTSRPFCVAELSAFFFFFLRMYQTVDLATPNVPAISLMDLFCFWSLTITCFTSMERSFDRMMRVHSNSLHIQMTHLESTPDLLPAWCRNNERIAHTCPWNCFCQLSNLWSNLWSLEKGGGTY